MEKTDPDRHSMTLVYDDDCGICQWSADWVLAQNPDVTAVSSRQFLRSNPEGWDPERFKHEALWIDGWGNLWWGPECILALFRVTGHRVLGWKGWLPLARLIYPVISRNRSRISRLFGLKAECKLV